jgi:hypothetical protein
VTSRDFGIDRDGARWARQRSALLAPLAVLLSLAVLLGFIVVASAEGALGTETARGTTRLLYAPGKIVPIPASIPHEEGDMVDRRIIRDLRWLAQRYPIFVTDGYSGPLPSGEHAGCHGCHVKNSDHYNGLAVDIVPIDPSFRCDARWRGITRLARWAEPRPNRPVAPFRWVGYDGDSGHGCGHHLHLSWSHADVKPFRLAEWVEVLPPELTLEAARKPRGEQESKQPAPEPSAPAGPSGGVSRAPTGGVAPRGSGD